MIIRQLYYVVVQGLTTLPSKHEVMSLSQYKSCWWY